MATIASTGSAHLMSGRLNVAQVLAAAQTELLELLGDPAVKKVGGAGEAILHTCCLLLTSTIDKHSPLLLSIT